MTLELDSFNLVTESPFLYIKLIGIPVYQLRKEVK